MTDASVQRLKDRLMIAETVTKVGVLADQGDMVGLRQCFSKEVDVDYSSLRPTDQVGPIKVDDMLALWQSRWHGVVTMHHHIANVIPTINGDTATCIASVIATHHRKRLDDEGYILWQLGAYYDYRLQRQGEGWVVTGSRITRHWERTEDAPPPSARS